MMYDRTARTVNALLSVDPAMRDAAWERDLEKWLPLARFSAPVSTASTDTMRFLEASVVEDAMVGVSFENVIHRATEAGSGLLLSVGGNPAVQMSFGVLATYRMFQDWWSPSTWSGGRLPEGSEVLRRAEKVEIGPPNAEYLPPFIRRALRLHLEAAGIPQPRVLLVHWLERSGHRDLAFNIERAQFSPEAHDALMESVLWFLPEGYQVVSWDSIAQAEEGSASL